MATKVHSVATPCGMAINHPTAPRAEEFDCRLCEFAANRAGKAKQSTTKSKAQREASDDALHLDIHSRVKKLTYAQKQKLNAMTSRLGAQGLPKDDIRRQENGGRHLEYREQCLTKIENAAAEETKKANKTRLKDPKGRKVVGHIDFSAGTFTDYDDGVTSKLGGLK